jgi:hypothetical protein
MRLLGRQVTGIGSTVHPPQIEKKTASGLRYPMDQKTRGVLHCGPMAQASVAESSVELSPVYV